MSELGAFRDRNAHRRKAGIVGEADVKVGVPGDRGDLDRPWSKRDAGLRRRKVFDAGHRRGSDQGDRDVLWRGFDALDEEDLREWLGRHGAGEATLARSPVLRGLYDLTFAYREGDKRRPSLAAGKGLQSLLMMINYEGSFMWRMRAGWATWCSRRCTSRSGSAA